MKRIVVSNIAVILLLNFTIDVHAQNLVENGDFEKAGSGWTKWSSPQFWAVGTFGHDYTNSCTVWPPSPYPYTGTTTHCQHVGTDRVHGGLYQVIDVVPGKEYRITGRWSGGGGGLNSEPDKEYSAWYEVVVYHGVADDAVIDTNSIAFQTIAKKEFSGAGDQNFSFGWEDFDNTFQSQSSKITLALKTGQYGYTWDAIAAYHDNIQMHSVTPWSIFMPAISAGNRGSERQ